MLRLSELPAGQVLIRLACQARYDAQIARPMAEARRIILRRRAKQGGRTTAARRELARLAAIGIRPIK